MQPKASYEAFGNVHVVCNDTVSQPAAASTTSPSTRLALGARREPHGRPAWHPAPSCRTSAPMAKAAISSTPPPWPGMISGLGFSPYAASKFAVVTMSEGLVNAAQATQHGVSVLFSGFISTRIGESGRNRQQRYGSTRTHGSASPAGALLRPARRLPRSPARSIRCRRAGPRGDPRGGTLRLHASRECAAKWKKRFAAILAAMDKVAACARASAYSR